MGQYFRHRLGIGLAVCLLLALTACAVPEHVKVPDVTRSSVKPLVQSDRLAEVSRVAVLPFELVKGESTGAEVVRRSFYNHLSSKKFQDMELYQIDTKLRDHGITSAADLSGKSPQELASLLEVDAVVLGKVLDYTRYFAVAAASANVSLHVTMHDGRDGAVLWEVNHTSRSSQAGLPSPDPISMAIQIISATYHVRDVQLLRNTEDLCRDIVTTLPGPTLSAALQAPTIQTLVQDASDTPKKAGDVIKVVMLGDPGHHAAFHIGAFRSGLPMVEDPDGTYIGSYQVQPGDNVQDVLIEGQLRDERGNQSRWIDVLGSVTLDTQPPSPPGALEVVGRDAAVVVRWQPNPEADLAGYRLYRSASALSGYDMVQQVEVPEVRDAELTNFQRYYYQVAALDRAGNESARSETVAGLPVKSGPTPVTSDLADDTTWYVGASPYVLQNPITVRAGITLTIEPGVTVESGGPGLHIRGSLLAVGQEKALIVFRGQPTSADLKAWEGITFDNTGTSPNRLEHVKISDAQVAIRAASSSPEIRHTILTQNDIALLLTDLAKPHIEANSITDNRQDGIVMRRAVPTIIHNDITFNAGNGMTLVASAPILTENNIHSNQGYQLAIEEKGTAIVNVQNNWWGTTDRTHLAQLISGPVSYAKILDAPYPEGQPVVLPVMTQAAVRPEPAQPPTPTMSAADLAAQGQAALQHGQLHEALAAFTQALSLQPDNDQMLFRVGVIHYQMGQFEATLTAMQQAVALRPDDAEYHYHLGLVYSELGKSEQAVAAWQRVLEIDSTHDNARMLLGFEQQQRH